MYLTCVFAWLDRGAIRLPGGGGGGGGGFYQRLYIDYISLILFGHYSHASANMHGASEK